LDAKEIQLFNFYYNKFVERSFDEKDLYSFLILVREDAEEIQVIKELGDFIVQREKNQGYVKAYFVESERFLNNIGKEKNLKKIENVFSFKEIRNGFNSLFLKNGFEKLSSDTINDFILCVISLLQGVKLVSGKGKREVGHLSFAVSSKEIFLMGNMKFLRKGRYVPVSFQILSANNIYEKVTPQDKNDTPHLFLEEIMEVINIDKTLFITFPNLEPVTNQ